MSNNQELTAQQKHVIHIQTWNENNSEYYVKQNRLRAEKHYKINAIPKLEATIKQYKKRLQSIENELEINRELHVISKKQYTPRKGHTLQKQSTNKPNDSTICYICDIPYSTKERFLKHNARRHGEPIPLSQ